MLIAGAMWALIAYSIGYKAGHKDGYGRGKSVARHAASRRVSEYRD